MRAKRKSKAILDLKPFLIGISVPLAVFTLFIGYKVYSTDKLLIPISVFALLAGLFFEYRRISDNWSAFLGTAFIAFILSFYAFLPGKRETNYFLDNHIELWPYMFCLFFILFAIGFAGDKVIPKLTEGITLLQSLALIYWIADTGFITLSHAYLVPFVILALGFAAISFYNAFTYNELTRKTRLILSIWSSIIILLFGADNIYGLYQKPPIESTNNILLAFYIAAQFFLLGISSIYSVQNYFMLVDFLPGKEYFTNLKKLNKQHIDRYSAEQVKKSHSVLCVLVVGTIFGLNYYFKFFPRNFVIWSVFALFPFVVNIFDTATNKKPQTSDAIPADE